MDESPQAQGYPVREQLERAISRQRRADQDPGKLAESLFRRHDPYSIELGDLNVIAERHYQRGLETGTREGVELGETRGRRKEGIAVAGRVHVAGLALAERVREMLDQLQSVLADNAEGERDRRTKAEVRAEAEVVLRSGNEIVDVLWDLVAIAVRVDG